MNSKYTCYHLPAVDSNPTSPKPRVFLFEDGAVGFTAGDGDFNKAVMLSPQQAEVLAHYLPLLLSGQPLTGHIPTIQADLTLDT